MKNRTVLLSWGDHRAGWVAPFERLRDRFEFTFLSHVAPPPAGTRKTDLPAVYWDDYRSAHELLDAVRPSRVVFQSIATGRQIALNVAARTRGIPTYLLDHGLFSDLARYIPSRRAPVRPGGGQPAAAGRAALKFLVRSLGATNLAQGPSMAFFFALRTSHGQWHSLRWARGEFRRPDRYISFTPANSQLWRDACQAKDAEIDYIGIPEFDEIFAEGEKPPGSGAQAYDLLIDSPVVDEPRSHTHCERTRILEVYRRLAAWSAEEGRRFKVKLHPYSYADEWRPDDIGVEWVSDAALGELLTGATRCFSLWSTLMLPAVALRPTCLLTPFDIERVQDIVRCRAAVSARFEQVARGVRPNFESIERAGVGFDRFVRRFLYASDGGSAARLGLILERGLDGRSRRSRLPISLSRTASLQG